MKGFTAVIVISCIIIGSEALSLGVACIYAAVGICKLFTEISKGNF